MAQIKSFTDSKGKAIDMVELYQHFQNLTWSQMTKSVQRALSSGAKIIVDATKAEMRTSFPKAFNSNPKYIDKIGDAPRYSVWKEGDTLANIHILGTRKKGSQTFKAKFFETGTKVRDEHYSQRLKRMVNKGSIEPLHFFKNAIQKNHNKAVEQVTRTLEQTVDKLNNDK